MCSILVGAVLATAAAPALSDEPPELPAAQIDSPEETAADIEELIRRLEDAEHRIRELEAAGAAGAAELSASPAVEGDSAEPAGDFDARLEQLEQSFAAQRSSEQKRKDAAALKPTVNWTGEVQTDAVWFGQSPRNRQAVGDLQDGVDFRRARLGAFGEVFESAEYRIEMDFAFAGRPSFLDNWIGLRGVPVLGSIKIGRFFEPFSLERITSNRFLTFMERWAGDEAFAPARRTGIMFYHNADDGRITWAAGAFRTFTDDWGDDVGDSSAWSGTTRVTWLPWYDEESGGRYFMHLGAGYSFRSPGDRTITFRARPEIRLKGQGFDVPFFVNTGPIQADHWQLIGAEWAIVLDSFSMQSEVIVVPVSRFGGPDPTFSAVYVFASYFLTGEHRPYQKIDTETRRRAAIFDRVVPSTNFLKGPLPNGNPRGIGAWEAAVRWSYINLTDAGIAGGRMQEITAGLNWYWNPFTKMQFNYVHPLLDRPPVGDSTADVYGVRFHFDF